MNNEICQWSAGIIVKDFNENYTRVLFIHSKATESSSGEVGPML